MANDSGDKAKVELQIQINDMFSTTLKELGKGLDNANKQVLQLGQSGSSSLEKFKKSNEALRDSVKGSHAAMKEMSTTLGGMSNLLTGGAGVVAAFYSAATSLQSFAANRVQLQMLSTDVGFSTKRISSMRQGIADMGKTTEEANQFIGTLGGLLKDVAERKEGSALVDLFTQMGRPEMGAKILRNGQDLAKSADEILSWFKRQEPEVQSFFSRQTGLTESILANLIEYEAKKKAVYESDFKHSQDYLRNMNAFQTELSNIWEQIKEAAVGAIDDNAFDKLNKQLKQEVEGIKLMYEDLSNLVKNQPFGKNFDFLNKTPGELFGGSTKPADPSSTFNERFPEKKDWLKQGLEVDSNKSLRDIRDVLLRMEIGGGGGGEGGFGGAGAGAGTSYGVGAKSEALRASLGGFREGGGGSRGDRNNNPGNLRYGPHAKAFGATHADAGGFAVFPDAASGAAAHETLLKSTAYSGLTLHEFAKKYAEGSPDWEKTVGKGMGGLGPNDVVNNQDPRLSGAIRQAEGTGTGGAGSGIPSKVLEEARAVVRAGGGAEAAKSYIQSKGYNVDSAWCGDFAAAVVRSAGGRPPKGYPIASNWRKFGDPVEGDPHPGDIAVRRGVATGSAGSHVTIVDSFDSDTGKFTGIGGNQGRIRSNFARSAYDFRRGEEASARMDKAQSAAAPAQQVDASLDIDMKNMPSWVKTSVDGGAFKKLRVTRSTPQGGKESAGNAADNFNSWSP
jgi:hypothetical protein